MNKEQIIKLLRENIKYDIGEKVIYVSGSKKCITKIEDVHVYMAQNNDFIVTYDDFIVTYDIYIIEDDYDPPIKVTNDELIKYTPEKEEIITKYNEMK